MGKEDEDRKRKPVSEQQGVVEMAGVCAKADKDAEKQEGLQHSGLRSH